MNPSSLYHSYTIPQGAMVRVSDHMGNLHNHKLKHSQQFHDGDRVFPEMMTEGLEKEILFQEWGIGGALTLKHLDARGFVIFATGKSKWPYMIVKGFGLGL